MLSKVKLEDNILPVIFGIEGTKITKEEKTFFKQANPLGFILFARNCEDPKQVKKLTDDLKKLLGRDAPILIDQEGGRVQRLGEPHWQKYPPAASFSGAVTRDFAAGIEELSQSMNALAGDLSALGIHVNCAPVMDISFAETHESIGDRSFSSDPQIVALMAGHTCRSFLSNGVIPVLKHMPGQGRAQHDSHHKLPVVDATLDEMYKQDFLPYREIRSKAYSEALWGMVAHVIYKNIDAHAAASCSRNIIHNVIRDKMEFTGLLLSDDICMGALKDYGDMQYRAEKSLRAGCDVVLHCNGNLAQMEAIAARVEPMREKSIKRYNQSAAWLNRNNKAAA